MDITPPHLRCGMGSCPSVHYLKDGDYTPEHLRCDIGASCPGVRGHNGKLVIVGRKADDIATELGLGVGPDEAVIEIGEEYFSALQKSVGEDAEEDPLAMECDAEPLFARADREIAKLDAAAAVASNMRRPRHDNDFGRWAQLIEDMKAWMVERIEIDHPSRPMVGLLSQLTEEQRAALFAYDGPEYLGGDDKRPDEERASAMSAHSKEAEHRRHIGVSGDVCEKCNGAGWLWWHELDEYYGTQQQSMSDDTRYLCDGIAHKATKAIGEDHD